MNEIWKPIEGTNGVYEVSNTGKVRSNNYNNTHTTKELKQRIDRYGYPCIHYSVNGKRIYSTVHRLVATAFIPNPCEYPAVNHKDANKENNNVSNLEWVTNKQNTEHALNHGLLDNLFEKRDEALGAVKKPIVAVNISTGEEIYYSSQNEARTTIGGNAHQVASGKKATCKGHVFYEPTNDPYENKRRRTQALEKAMYCGGKGANKRKAVVVHKIENGEEVTFRSVSEAIKSLPEKPCLYDVLSGKIHQSKGYTCRYV